ncbi:uncharacterized protein OCT59_009221 [Rhizophagus irregularis]|uniref:uncharacterized protein n=1 Tax=Rhizophagus irregularis TaxID=588596 RepID=UPI003328C6BB|nr:hypothetical protein OCT59_009221 [Rhizophagus irregularis]
MAALNLNANLPVYIQWPDDAALTLIQRRQAYQPLFTTTRLHNQKQLWHGIAHDIRNNHTFRPTRKQCREKWNALKAGYENLERLINRNPDDYPTRTRLCTTRGSTKNSQTSSGELSSGPPGEIGWIVGHTSIESAGALGALAPDPPITTESAGALVLDLPTTESAGALILDLIVTDIRRRYSHAKPIKPIRIRNQFSYSNLGETTTSGERRSPVRLPDNDDDNMDFQYNHEDNDLSFQNINDDDNEYGSIGPQYYNDEMEDDDQSFDNEEEEETDNEYNSEEEEENDNEYNRDEEEDDDNGDNNEEEEEEGNNEEEEEHNNDEEERNDNEEEEIHQIVEALDEDKIPSCNAYEDLVDIIHNPQFEPTHVVKNIRRFQSWRKRLPLLPIITKPIQILPKKTPSTSPGVNSETKLEYWHGTLWGESPLFGQHEIIISEVIYQSGDFVYYHDNGLKKRGRLRAILKDENGNYELRVQLILNYDDLPGNIKGLSRRRRSLTGKVWFQDEPFITIITSQILEKVTIMMTYKHQIIPEGSLRITEIIYKCNDRWHVRDAKLSYQHPSDYISVRNPPSSMPVYKLFLDLYYDDFEIKKFEKGKIMTVQGQDAWVIAGLDLVTADLPQGNNMAGVLRHNANKGCRTCTTKKESLSTYNQDSVTTLRYHHITDEEISKISQESWSRLPNPISHYNSFMMSDLLRLAMIMPFLLNRFLKESSLKNNEAATIRQRIDVARISLVLKAIISCWVQVAKTMKAVFNKEFTLDSYEELQLCLKEEFLILPKVFASFVNLPNIHINMHLLMHAKTFGTLVNSQVGIKEMVHRIFKGMQMEV